MNQNSGIPLFPQTSDIYFPCTNAARTIYWAIVLILGMTLVLMHFISVDISVRSPGIIRPASERTVVRSIVTGCIQKLYFNEGSYVEKDSVILTLRDDLTQPKIQSLDFDIRQNDKFVHDLRLLTTYVLVSFQKYPALITPLYKGQLSRFQYQLNDRVASIKKVARELVSDSILYRDEVIAGKEYYDKTIESQKLSAALEAFKADQLSIWQQELSQIESELTQLQSTRNQLLEEAQRYKVRAPVAGVLQGLSRHYEGGLVQSGEVFCELSPETELIAECYVQTRDVGFLGKDHLANFQVDAYDHNYFGQITGKIISIDNDFTIVNELPVFKVRCRFDDFTLKLKNGYTRRLKKGLKLQARFMIARRTIWQLLFDKIDDWVNPVAF